MEMNVQFHALLTLAIDKVSDQLHNQAT